MHLFGKHNYDDLTDEELLVKYKDTGKAVFFDKLYERYLPLVYGLCLKYLHDISKSQDAVVDIYESLSGKIGGYDIKVFKNWLYSVVKNHCFKMLKDDKKEIIIDFNSQVMESDTILDLLDDENEEERENALGKCLKQLPEPQRISVTLFFYEDKSYQDIVDETGYNMKSVKSYIQNGKRNLKICIDKIIGK